MAQETPEIRTGRAAGAGPIRTNGSGKSNTERGKRGPGATDADADLDEEHEAAVEVARDTDLDSDTELAPTSELALPSTRVITLRHTRPFESPGRSAQNHWVMIAVLALLGMLLGAVFGFAKTPTYTAEARLVVGKTAQLSNLAAIPGLDAAGQSLASSYSRLASTDSVQQATAKRLGGTLNGSLSASPIALAPIVVVEGSATTSDGAVAIAKAGSAALVEAVNQLNADQNKSADQLLQQYKAADHDLLVATIALNSAKAQQAGNNTDEAQAKVNSAQTEVDAAQVKLNALSAAYSGVYSPTAIDTQLLQRVGTASATGSNRRSSLEIGVLVGLVAGGLFGLGIAVVVDLRARRNA